MKVSCLAWPGCPPHTIRDRPAYVLKGEPPDARLVVRFPDEDSVLPPREAQRLGARTLEARAGELRLLREGGYGVPRD